MDVDRFENFFFLIILLSDNRRNEAVPIFKLGKNTLYRKFVGIYPVEGTRYKKGHICAACKKSDSITINCLLFFCILIRI